MPCPYGLGWGLRRFTFRSLWCRRWCARKVEYAQTLNPVGGGDGID